MSPDTRNHTNAAFRAISTIVVLMGRCANGGTCLTITITIIGIGSGSGGGSGGGARRRRVMARFLLVLTITSAAVGFVSAVRINAVRQHRSAATSHPSPRTLISTTALLSVRVTGTVWLRLGSATLACSCGGG